MIQLEASAHDTKQLADGLRALNAFNDVSMRGERTESYKLNSYEKDELVEMGNLIKTCLLLFRGIPIDWNGKKLVG